MKSRFSNQYGNREIAQKTAWGLIWNFSAYFLGKLIVLITTAILARLLAKGDFGLVAVAVVAINYLSVLKDLGLGVALIQRKGDMQEAANTVFTINLFLGLALSALVMWTRASTGSTRRRAISCAHGPPLRFGVTE